MFPWVEQEQAALLLRTQKNPLSNDMALKQFLQLLIWLRTVLLQDAAVLFTQDSTLPIFRYSIFWSATFHTFAAASQLTLANAEEKARLAFEHLPDHLIRSLRGILADSKMEQQQDREEHRRQLSAVDEHFSRVETLLKTLVGAQGCGQRGKAGETLSICGLLVLYLVYSTQPHHLCYLLSNRHPPLQPHHCHHCHHPQQLFPLPTLSLVPLPSTFLAHHHCL